jgi:putative ABC transport system permease protein
MNWWQRLRNRPALEQSLDAELRDHFERQVADGLRQGLDEDEARRRARLQFGGIEQVKEDCRDARGTRWAENLWHDLRFALRSLRKSPAFTAAAVCTLALGIGANAAIFSVVNAVFLRPLPYRDPSRLMWATEYQPKSNQTIVYTPEYAAWKEQNRTFDYLEGFGTTTGMNLSVAGQPAMRVDVANVTPGFFPMVGVAPHMGRQFSPEESQAAVAIVSDSFWRASLDADPAVLGHTVTLNGKSWTIVGVMPPGFVYPDAPSAAVWLPGAVPPGTSDPSGGMHFVQGVVGRLKPGVTAEQARADLSVIARRMDNLYPKPWFGMHLAATVRVVPLQQQLGGNSRAALLVLTGAVAFILLIACANVANLFLTRAVARAREISIRTAIGASRGRLVQLLLTESLALGAMGGALGMVLLFWGRTALTFLIPREISPDIPIDWHVVVFAVACALTAGMLFGLAPAVAASRIRLSTTGRHGSRIRGGLVVCQLALSLILLTGAGLLLRSFVVLFTSQPGFDPHQVLTASVSLSPPNLYGPRQQIAFAARVVASLESIPGVEYAAVSNQPPFGTFNAIGSGLHAEGQEETAVTVVFTRATANYFTALRVPLIAGRAFRAGDGDVAILNQTLARVLFPNRDPVGQRIAVNAKDPLLTVVGVVADTRHRALDDKIWPELFQPFEWKPSPFLTLVIRSAADVTSAVRSAVQAIDPNQPLFRILPLEDQLSDSLAERRRRAVLLGLFAALALAIAAVGVYGVMSYAVTRRTHEVGIRLALGAQRSDVLLTFLVSGLRLAGLGIVAGLLGARALTHLLNTFLYGVRPTDPYTFLVVSAALAAAAAVASYLPARRATRVDPLVALRHE